MDFISLGCSTYESIRYFFLNLDVFEAFVHMAFEHDLLEHPGVKAVMEIGGMLAETYCDTNMDGEYEKFLTLSKLKSSLLNKAPSSFINLFIDPLPLKSD